MDNKTPQIKRTLGWGFEYLSYMNEEIKQLEYLLNHLETDAEKLVTKSNNV